MKYLSIFLIIFLCFSCSKNEDNPWVIQESSQIMNNYADTLEWSIKDAKEVRDTYNSWVQDFNNQINNAINF